MIVGLSSAELSASFGQLSGLRFAAAMPSSADLLWSMLDKDGDGKLDIVVNNNSHEQSIHIESSSITHRFIVILRYS